MSTPKTNEAFYTRLALRVNRRLDRLEKLGFQTACIDVELRQPSSGLPHKSGTVTVLVLERLNEYDIVIPMATVVHAHPRVWQETMKHAINANHCETKEHNHGHQA